MFLGFWLVGSFFLFLKCGCMLPGRQLFWGPDRCGHWGFQVICVSGYWELTCRNGVDVAPPDGVHRRQERRICLVPWGWEQRMRRGHSRSATVRDETRRLDLMEVELKSCT